MLLSVQGLRKSFNGRTVLKGVDFSVAAGELVAFLGANGSGKTTTLRCVMGITAPDSGSISIEGTALETLQGRELQQIIPVAFLPENHALAVAIMSYNGKVDFGLLGDYDAMPDLEEFGGMLEDALAELLKEARKRTKAAAKANAKSNGVKKSGSDGRRAPSTRSPQASP